MKVVVYIAKSNPWRRDKYFRSAWKYSDRNVLSKVALWTSPLIRLIVMFLQLQRFIILGTKPQLSVEGFFLDCIKEIS